MSPRTEKRLDEVRALMRELVVNDEDSDDRPLLVIEELERPTLVYWDEQVKP